MCVQRSNKMMKGASTAIAAIILPIICTGLHAFQAHAFAPSVGFIRFTTTSSGEQLIQKRTSSTRVPCNLPRQFAVTRRSTSIFASSPDGDQGGSAIRRPPPRRTLKKRQNKRRQKIDDSFEKTRSLGDANEQMLGEDLDFIETRPVRRADAVEAGLDYWIDENDLDKERMRRIATKNRKSTEGEIPKERLREEVVAPYKQNWIGFFSVFIVILSTIATQFPEVMQTPVIRIPDL